MFDLVGSELDMRLSTIRIQNFRCVENDELCLTPYTVLIGRNGTGKSTFLEALEFFYTPNYPISKTDFTDFDDAREMSVAATFVDLNQTELAEFQRYVVEGKLVVERVARRDETGARYVVAYHGSRLQNPDFAHVRALTGRNHLDAYRVLREGANYAELPAVRSETDAREAMENWDRDHPEACALQRDDGRFFGFVNVGVGKLDKYTGFVRVPAILNSKAQCQESAANTLKILVDTLVRERGGARAVLDQLKTRVEQEYSDILEQPAFDLTPVSEALTDSMSEFVPGVTIKVSWNNAAGIKFVEPSATVDLEEGGLATPPQYKGHGLLRAYELSVLGLMSERARAMSEGERVSRNVLIAIDEPELYQHPAQARLIASRLQRLAGAVIGESLLSVVCTSHSPLFVELEHCEAIRVVRRGNVGRIGGRCTIRQVRFAELARKLGVAYAREDQFSEESLKARMAHLFHPTITESVFADFAVLVEGTEDVAWLEGCFESAGQLDKLRRLGVFIVPVGGKQNMDRMVLLLNELGIPNYSVFDSDYGEPGREPGERRTNAAVASLCTGAPVADVPVGTQVHGEYAVLHPNLTDHMKNELGPAEYLEARDVAAASLGYEKPSQAVKNARVIAQMLSRLSGQGRRSRTGLEILAAVKARALIAEEA